MTTEIPTTKEFMNIFKVDNVHAIPRIAKVVLNVGVGKNRDNSAYVEAVRRDLAAISGQAAYPRMARKAVAGFNVREGNLVGYTVTLRGKRMQDFVQRFVHVTLPRVRDFRGLKPQIIDGAGNMNVGIVEHLAFPEIHPDKTDVIFGVQATFVTTADNKEDGELLFRKLGFPLRTADDVEEELQFDTAASRAAKARVKHSS